jgi:hypothetical protein
VLPSNSPVLLERHLITFFYHLAGFAQQHGGESIHWCYEEGHTSHTTQNNGSGVVCQIAQRGFVVRGIPFPTELSPWVQDAIESWRVCIAGGAEYMNPPTPHDETMRKVRAHRRKEQLIDNKSQMERPHSKPRHAHYY